MAHSSRWGAHKLEKEEPQQKAFLCSEVFGFGELSLQLWGEGPMLGWGWGFHFTRSGQENSAFVAWGVL